MNGLETVVLVALLVACASLLVSDTWVSHDRRSSINTMTNWAGLTASLVGLLADVGPAGDVLQARRWVGSVAILCTVALLTYRQVHCRRQLAQMALQRSQQQRLLAVLADNSSIEFEESICDVHLIDDNGDAEVTSTHTTRALQGRTVPFRSFFIAASGDNGKSRTFRDIRLSLTAADEPELMAIEESSERIRAFVAFRQPIGDIPYTWKIKYKWPGIFRMLVEHGEDTHSITLENEHYGHVVQEFIFPEGMTGHFKSAPPQGRCEVTEVAGRFTLRWSIDKPAPGSYRFRIQREGLDLPSDESLAVTSRSQRR